MNVGEKRRSQLGSCDYQHGGKISSLRLSTVGDYRGHESLVIRLLHDEEQELRFWFQDIHELEKGFRQRGLYLFAGPVGSGKTTLMHELAKSLFKGQQVMSIEDPVEIKQEERNNLHYKTLCKTIEDNEEYIIYNVFLLEEVNEYLYKFV